MLLHSLEFRLYFETVALKFKFEFREKNTHGAKSGECGTGSFP